ncbi:MAG: hypothetical protein QXE92_02615 [Thermofilaceae archaeon]
MSIEQVREQIRYIDEQIKKMYNVIASSISEKIPVEVGVSVASNRGWNTVVFNKPLPFPVVVASLSLTIGEHEPKKFPAPSISIPKITVNPPSPPEVPQPPQIEPQIPPPPQVTVPQVSISIPQIELPKPPTITPPQIQSVEIPRISRPDFAAKLTEEAVKMSVVAALGYWGIYDWMKWSVVSGIIKMAWYVGSVLNMMWDSYIQPQINNVRDKINETIAKTVEAMRTVTNITASAINTATSQLRDKTQDALNSMRSNIEQSINSALKNLKTTIEEAVKESMTATSQIIKTSLNSTTSKLNENIKTAVNNAANSIINNVNNSLSDMQRQIEEAINSLSSQVSREIANSVEASIASIYEICSMPEGWRLTPVIIRNINQTGFEWWSPQKGATLNWIAISLPQK